MREKTLRDKKKYPLKIKGNNINLKSIITQRIWIQIQFYNTQYLTHTHHIRKIAKVKNSFYLTTYLHTYNNFVVFRSICIVYVVFCSLFVYIDIEIICIYFQVSWLHTNIEIRSCKAKSYLLYIYIKKIFTTNWFYLLLYLLTIILFIIFILLSYLFMMFQKCTDFKCLLWGKN